ncbi:hypothetical protein [Geomobilimonas luticola]|uniref:LptF/LptG family permease n=1 Tax=Geomobilimonas luticola TaxID=1114878 RepID=A0ABS5SCD6_9BACT|nr:hypothetical protein [Geomobilimonas luticola]MBT0652277.1 hypothetical protein [Geomobilimonas luticola]
MDKQEMLDKTRETLSPFETEHIVEFLKNMSMKSVMENPWLLGFLIIIFFFAVVKRSKAVLVSLFAFISIMFLIRYTLMGETGNELTLQSTLPFTFGALAIGATLIYFVFIKSE